jgi:PBSX family phage portal protein
VAQIEFIKDVPTVSKTIPLSPHIETDFYFKGRAEARRKKYCKYRQAIGGSTVYFKEFGDPRIMDNRTGAYSLEGGVPLEYQANEIIEFAIGAEPYGEVRWAGQILGIDGSRKAETLNNNYFSNGRHTPLLIMIKGGTLTDESFSKLQTYINDVKGEAGQHAFIVLEAENDSRTDLDGEKAPEIEIKDLASILQKDELFQEYLDNSRRRAQSAFQLPDLYVGYTTDFNRATAQTAMEVTEKQVFQPERRSLAWALNNKLLNGYRFQYVEAYFKEPDVSNPDDLAKILNIGERAGGLTPNKAKEIIYSILGDNFEPYNDDWGDIPLVRSKADATRPVKTVAEQLQEQIQKATARNDDAIVAVMKEVRSVIAKRHGGGGG